MENPGIKNLGDVALAAINAATVATVVTASNADDGSAIAYIDDLGGMLAASIAVNFATGTGGTSLKVMIETSLDQGQTWLEVARLAFALGGLKVVNLSGLTPVATPVAGAALSDNTIQDGILGDRFRARILTVGTYTGNTSLSIRMNAR
jgi:hypothetical protein